MDKKSNVNKKKILFLITKSNWGGAQRYVFDLATSLPRDKYTCIVATGGNGEMVERLEKAKIKVVCIKTLQRDISLSKEIMAFWQVANIIRTEDPDVLHINSSKAGFMGAFLGRALFIPRVIFTAHGWAFNENRGFFSRTLFKTIHYLTVRFAHQTITVSKALQAQMNWPGVASKMQTVYLGLPDIRTHDRSVARQKLIDHLPALNLYRDDFWSMTIAELHPVKQHEVSIKALAAVVRYQPKVRHLIVGAGGQEEYLRSLVTEFSLQRNVFFTGHLTEASQYLKAADLFILPSRSEALGYVLLEACAAGIPSIASNVGGIPEIITHQKEGLLFPEGDIDILVSHYQKLAGDQDLQNTYAKAAQARAADFSLTETLRHTQSVYTKD